MVVPAETLLQTGGGPEWPRTWVQQLVPKIPGASPDFIEQVVLEVIRDYYGEGSCWIEPTPWLVIDNQNEEKTYAVPAPFDNVDVRHILCARDDRKREFFATDVLSAFYRQGDPTIGFFGQYQDQARDLTYMSKHPGEVTFQYRFPVDVMEVKFLVTVVPRTIILPKWARVFDEPGIEEGVLAKFFMMPNQRWTAESNGNQRWRRYLNMRAIARDRAYKGNSTSSRPWRFPRFGA